MLKCRGQHNETYNHLARTKKLCCLLCQYALHQAHFGACSALTHRICCVRYRRLVYPCRPTPACRASAHMTTITHTESAPKSFKKTVGTMLCNTRFIAVSAALDGCLRAIMRLLAPVLVIACHTPPPPLSFVSIYCVLPPIVHCLLTQCDSARRHYTVSFTRMLDAILQFFARLGDEGCRSAASIWSFTSVPPSPPFTPSPGLRESFEQ